MIKMTNMNPLSRSSNNYLLQFLSLPERENLFAQTSGRKIKTLSTIQSDNSWQYIEITKELIFFH